MELPPRKTGSDPTRPKSDGDPVISDAPRNRSDASSVIADRSTLPAPSDKCQRQRQRRGPIEPLRVIDDTKQRTRLGHLRDKATHSQTHQEPIRRRPWTQAEHHTERVTLRGGQPLEAIEHRPA